MNRSDLHLVLGALSLTALGIALRTRTSAAEVVFPLATAVLLVVVAYGFNRIADAAELARVTAKRAIGLIQVPSVPRSLALTAGASALGAALMITFLPPMARVAAITILVIGVGYSLGIPVGGTRFRPKNVLVLKNALIGASWGLLVPLGAGEASREAWLLGGFAAIQVFVGSVTRDMDDVAEDRAVGVRTLPVVLGARRTLRVLRVLNVLSALPLAGLAVSGRDLATLAVLVGAAVAWRFALLHAMTRGARSSFWLQSANLATCHVMLVAALAWRLA